MASSATRSRWASCSAKSLEGLAPRQVRGLGLMQAFEFAEPHAKAFQQACLEAGLSSTPSTSSSVRFVPPLIITADEIDRAKE